MARYCQLHLPAIRERLRCMSAAPKCNQMLDVFSVDLGHARSRHVCCDQYIEYSAIVNSGGHLS